MTERTNPYVSHFKMVKPLIEYSQLVKALGLEKSLISLIEIRASQINGCGVCLDMHSRAAVENGESWERIVMLGAWRDTSIFTPREQAAMMWTETLTQLSEKGAPDAAYEKVRAEFSEDEIVALTLMISVINSFNRIGVGFHVPPISEQRKAA